jgi:hypothetical protein
VEAIILFRIRSGRELSELCTLCITFRVEAITIGYNLAISPIYITEQFGMDTATIGIILATDTGFGTLVSVMIALTKKGHTLVGKYLPSPYNLFVAMGDGITVFCVALARRCRHFL